MSLNEYSPSTPRRRRRGAELEGAVLGAAWEAFAESGYDALTYEAVAERAQTSRAVLYRRWPSKRELVLAAVSRRLTSERSPIPDTGSLRGDMIALLHAGNDSRARVAVQLAARLVSADDDAPSLADLRDTIAQRSREAMRAILTRARNRGEIADADPPRRVRSVALDLLGYHVLMSRRGATPEEIAEIVDDVFLPLVGARRP